MATDRGVAERTDHRDRFLSGFECRTLFVRTAVVLLLASAPYLYAVWTAPSDRAFMGLMADVPDHAQYWAWVTASERGLFISNTLTPEANSPVFLNVWMHLLAQLRRVSGVSFPELFQLWRIVATVLLVGGIHAFSRTVATTPRLQSWVFWLSLLGSGFGWTLVVAKTLTGLDGVPFPNDIYLFETNSFWALLSYPYIALAQGLIVWTFVGVLWSAGARPRRGAVVAVSAALGVAAFHAYDLITVYSVLSAWVLAETVRQRALPWRLISLTVVIGVVTAPIAIYYRLLTVNDPLWQAILAQYENAGVVTPPGLHLFALVGLPLLLAPFGVVSLEDEPLPPLIVVWAVVGGALPFMPTVYQVKLLTAWQFPLALLAARAWTRWTRSSVVGAAAVPTARGGRALLWGPLLIALVVPTNLYLFAWRFVDLGRHDRPYFLERDELTALDWLAKHSTSSDVVMARPDVGQFVPSYGRSRAYVAHWAMTNRFFERSKRADEFFNPATDPLVRRQTLDADHVTLILATRTEPLGVGSEAPPPWLQPVFSSGQVRVFQYQPVSASADRLSGAAAQ